MFPTKILLATDGSPESARAARLAVTLAEKLGSELHVVSVGSMPSVYAAPETTVLDPEFHDYMRERAVEDARAALQEEVAKIEEMGGRVAGTHAEAGRPDAGIVRVAEQIGAGVVVVGSRGLGPLRRALLGSVSHSVVRHAHGSVLVVRDGREREYLPGRVLAALDGSREAEAAARAAVEISAATDSELHLVYALPTQERLPYPNPMMAERWTASLEEAKREARRFVDGWAQRIRAAGDKVADAHLVFGQPDEEIVQLAEELDAGLVVMGSRGLGGIRRALMGSVSDSVVRHAHCPVLVVSG
jgi:nucleotide-binding universal stress UspA family protein